MQQDPGGRTVQVLGLYSPELTGTIAQVLGKLGTREAFVVCGEGTYDEISIFGPTTVSRLEGGKIETFQMTPEEYGFQRAAPEAISGGNAKENARIFRQILEGETGPKRDMVLLNSAAAFVAAVLDTDFAGGIKRAKDSIDSGRAREKLDSLVRMTNECRDFVRNEL